MPNALENHPEWARTLAAGVQAQRLVRGAVAVGGTAAALYALGTVGVAGSLVFYDALLPGVAREEDLDRVSALGYALGYGGSVVLFFVNVLLYLKPDLLGIDDRGTAVRLAFVSVAVWWGLFTIPVLRGVPEPPAAAAGRPGLVRAAGELDCLLVNTTGELKYFYEHATVIFVGKSLTAEGGQNPIEPGALGKAMVFGPNMQNFAEIAANLVAQKGALQVRNAAELETALEQLLADDKLREQLGQNALKVVKANLGAIDRTVEMIIQHLDRSGELYITRRA